MNEVAISQETFTEWSRQRQLRIEQVLERLLPSPELVPSRLHEAMRYAVLGGGKRVRPLLVYAAAELAEGAIEQADSRAAAVELIHAYSLVHDDLPCMDDDDLRRGKPSCHVRFNEATALLAGDALQSLAFQILPDLQSVKYLAEAAGSQGMAGGQAIDLQSVQQILTPEELEQMHLYKTGALIRAALRLGAACGRRLSAIEDRQLERFANKIGLAFQVIDDILDAESTSTALGKTAGKDALQAKPTYVSVLGLAGAKDHAQMLRDEALHALDNFGAAALRLRELTDLVILRQY